MLKLWPVAVDIQALKAWFQMNGFDVNILHFFNHFSQLSPVFDGLVVFISENTLLKGGVIMALFWFAWVQYGETQPERREFLIFGLFVTFLALFVARVLALTLPFRVRPLQNPLLGFRIPYSMNPDALIGWSSFPSDHVALFFSLAASFWFVSKRLGAFAYCYALFVISLPRIYLGIHYPTDIIAGALIGIGCAFLAKAVWLRRSLTRPALSWLDRHPAYGYVFLFLYTFEVAELFDSLRNIAHVGIRAVEIVMAKRGV